MNIEWNFWKLLRKIHNFDTPKEKSLGPEVSLKNSIHSLLENRRRDIFLIHFMNLIVTRITNQKHYKNLKATDQYSLQIQGKYIFPLSSLLLAIVMVLEHSSGSSRHEQIYSKIYME